MKDDRLYLHHMLERCRRITRFIEPGRAAFMASEELQDAVIRNVGVIGEAAKRVSAESRVSMAQWITSEWTSTRFGTSPLPGTRAPGGIGAVLAGEDPASTPAP